MDFSGRRVLVTGAEGFIGSTLVDLLLAEGAEVRALAHYKPYGSAGNLAGREDDVEIIAGDVRDPGTVDAAVADREAVFHLAALIGIPYSYRAPDSYVQTNVAGTHAVAAACLRHGARLVHTSTSEVYGTARTAPISEEHPLQPQSPYSASKIGADMMALSYRHAFGLPVSVVRPFNAYGPRQSARAIIPAILRQLHAGARELRLGSLTPTRDFTYAEDTARGFLAVAGSDRTLGEVVNIGSGKEISIGALAELLIEITGSDAAVVADPERMRPAGSEVERLLADSAKARELTGWEPRVGLREGLARTCAWIREQDRAPVRYEV
ncbi:SDR family NAD(P)-dependent oxidoreductase [Nocardiopsis sp. CNT-189]|uniref:SDR family NAD(P)-dependent oxidoreductase n=1 Tax=Nocardiopsis oceanisediminis TaxID=2816862 RepID=UPI003B2A7A5F